MIDLSPTNYSAFDKPEICGLLFYPRREMAGPPAVGPERLMIPVEHDVAVSGRFHLSGHESPTIVLFHGNGEIAADYDDIGSLYRGMGINFLPVDYRGYGLSSGKPTVTAMMRDSHTIIAYAVGLVDRTGFYGTARRYGSFPRQRPRTGDRFP